jgi:hypothetical protein
MATYFESYWVDSRQLSPEDELLDDEQSDVVRDRRQYWQKHVQSLFSLKLDPQLYYRWEHLWKEVWLTCTRLNEQDIVYLMHLDCYEQMAQGAEPPIGGRRAQPPSDPQLVARPLSVAARLNHVRCLAFKYGFCPVAFNNLAEAMETPVCSCHVCWDFTRIAGLRVSLAHKGSGKGEPELVVANLHGRPSPEALSRTRFGVVHL